MSAKKSKWVAIDGSLYVEKITDQYNRDSKVKYKVREAIAFNIGQEMAEYLAKLHNTALEMKNACY